MSKIETKRRANNRAVVIAKPKSEVPEPPKPPEPPAKPERQYTIEDAFDYATDGPNGRDDTTFHTERAVRAVAFLLDWYSDIGNDDVDGWAVHGLAHILNKAASDLGQYPPPAIRYIGGPAPKDAPEDYRSR